jgi:hypothetical protein
MEPNEDLRMALFHALQAELPFDLVIWTGTVAAVCARAAERFYAEALVEGPGL